jgi:aminoglycoside phosphotransferase family enzyme/predicted kinase
VAPTLPELLRNLLTPAAYPHPVEAIELVETHVSWVLLTGSYAYKIKRPVRYAFIDLSSSERRAFFCMEELRLNRRFAAELYVDVCQVTVHGGATRINGPGVVIDHAVRMRQFRREDELDRLLEAGGIEPRELEDFGRSLADIHQRLPIAPGNARYGAPDAVRSLVLDNLRQCIEADPSGRSSARLNALRSILEQRLELLEASLARRVAGGRVRECHGDLHSRNVVRRDGRLLAFDCLEFDPALRWIDVADEVAFLLMDIGVLRRPAHAHAFLSGYLAQSGDYEACRALKMYEAHRALVRAKVTALASAAGSAASPGDAARAFAQCRSYVDAARAALDEQQPRLILMSGVSGSGKTWLANRLAPLLAAIHLRSDVERKRFAEAPPGLHSGAVGGGRYTPEAKAHVYEHLVQCAEHALSGGYSVIVDATFTRREDRTRFRDLATRLGVSACVVHCRAAPQVLRARVAGRHEQGTDASEADLAVLQWQETHQQPLLGSEGLVAVEVDTTGNEPIPSIDDLVASLRAPAL